MRAEIQSFRNRSVLVSVADACCLCDIALLLRPFYLFPCGHKFHGDCLLAAAQPALAPGQRARLAAAQRQLAVLSPIELRTRTQAGTPLQDALRKEVDELVADECLFCGEHIIRSVYACFLNYEGVFRLVAAASELISLTKLTIKSISRNIL